MGAGRGVERSWYDVDPHTSRRRSSRIEGIEHLTAAALEHPPSRTGVLTSYRTPHPKEYAKLPKNSRTEHKKLRVLERHQPTYRGRPGRIKCDRGREATLEDGKGRRWKRDSLHVIHNTTSPGTRQTSPKAAKLSSKSYASWNAIRPDIDIVQVGGAAQHHPRSSRTKTKGDRGREDTLDGGEGRIWWANRKRVPARLNGLLDAISEAQRLQVAVAML
ncbi:hypothetical protein CVT26_004851 [Gymnopilus dilepis]|uniref:Uncharacterized protein n=1 Tax=Gymnopilus dilepis TaxID=231916 RepID=A0A409YTP5_9AGAR|nr:hypothetical protein CVT26_004851 [Gymnopilus dilepis]